MSSVNQKATEIPARMPVSMSRVRGGEERVWYEVKAANAQPMVHNFHIVSKKTAPSHENHHAPKLPGSAS